MKVLNILEDKVKAMAKKDYIKPVTKVIDDEIYKPKARKILLAELKKGKIELSEKTIDCVLKAMIKFSYKI
jgi:hypothetical protein